MAKSPARTSTKSRPSWNRRARRSAAGMELIPILPIFHRCFSRTARPRVPPWRTRCNGRSTRHSPRWRRTALWCGVGMPRISAACGNVASDLNLSRARPPLRILLLLAICLWQSGCFELIRRRPSDGDAVTARLDAGNLGKGRNVQRDSATPSPDSTASSEAAPIDGDPETVSPSPRPSATLTVDPAAPLTTGAVTEDPEEPGGLAMADAVEQTLTEKRPRRTPERTEQERRRLAAAWAARTRKQREIVKQVNEYVLWCIENEMWKIGRAHV